MFITRFSNLFEPIVQVENMPPLTEKEKLWFGAYEAIHKWPRSWWLAMMAKAGLTSLRRKKDRCVQITLDGLQCFRRHRHSGDCRFGYWSGGTNIQQQYDTKDPLEGAFIRRKKHRDDNKKG